MAIQTVLSSVLSGLANTAVGPGTTQEGNEAIQKKKKILLIW